MEGRAWTHARDAAEPAQAQQRGERLKFLFFWGGTGRRAAAGPARAAEHHMLAKKARLFGDEETRRAVLAADDGRATDVARWRGPNLLGLALMDVRARR